MRGAVRDKLRRKSAAAPALEEHTISRPTRNGQQGSTLTSSRPRALPHIHSDISLTGTTYAEVEVVTVATYRPRNLQRERTPYAQTLHTLNNSASHTTSATPKTPQDNWFKVPDPIPLPPLTSSSDNEEESCDYRGISCDQTEPVYAQVLKSCENRLTDISNVPPSPSPTEAYREGRGNGGNAPDEQGDSPAHKRGDSPASYIEAEPMSLLRGVREEDPLWYRQRDSLLLEIDPLPYETAVQSNSESSVANQLSSRCSPLSTPRMPLTPPTPSTPLTLRTPPLTPLTPPTPSTPLTLRTPPLTPLTLRTPPLTPSTPLTPPTPHTPSSYCKSSGAGCYAVHPRVSQLTPVADKYHADGPSSVKENKVFK